MPKKVKSAMEYLMTYGWAILIIVIVSAKIILNKPKKHLNFRASDFHI